MESLLKKKLPFYEQLSDADQAYLLENCRIATYQRGQTVYSPHKDCVGVLLILSGELRTYLISEDGREVTLYRLFSDDTCILSASCILNAITFDVFIDAELDTEILLINASAYAKLQAENLYVENFSYRIAVEKFSEVIWAMEQLLFCRFDQRLSTFLYDEAQKRQSTDIQLTHEQIAKYLGSAREVVSRMLKRFEQEGIVKLYRGGIQIIDMEKLSEKRSA